MGEFSEHTFKLIEILAHKVKRDRQRNPTGDGVGPKKAAALFRDKARNFIAIAAARGWANMLISGGYPNNKNSS